MRIVTRKEFLALPAPVLYSKIVPWVDRGFKIKTENCGDNDWFYDSVTPLDAKCDGDTDLDDKLEESLRAGTHLAMDFEFTGRDGCFDGDEVVFAVFDDEDIKSLVSRLINLLPNK